MASKYYYFSGIINWAKVHAPDKKYDVYTLDLVLDGASRKMYEDSGLKLKLRESEDGDYIKLRRPLTKTIKNEVIDLGPPEVLLKNKDGEFEPTTKLIGNGSRGVCKVRVYDSAMGKGHELQTVAIEDLVEYEESVGGEDYPF